MVPSPVRLSMLLAALFSALSAGCDDPPAPPAPFGGPDESAEEPGIVDEEPVETDSASQAPRDAGRDASPVNLHPRDAGSGDTGTSRSERMDAALVDARASTEAGGPDGAQDAAVMSSEAGDALDTGLTIADANTPVPDDVIGAIRTRCEFLRPDRVYMSAFMYGVSAYAVYDFDWLHTPCASLEPYAATLSEGGRVRYYWDGVYEMLPDVPIDIGGDYRFTFMPETADVRLLGPVNCFNGAILDYPDSDDFILNCFDRGFFDRAGQKFVPPFGLPVAVGRGGQSLVVLPQTEAKTSFVFVKDNAIQRQIDFPNKIYEVQTARSHGQGFMLAVLERGSSELLLIYLEPDGSSKSGGSYLPLGQVAFDYTFGVSLRVSSALDGDGVLYQMYTAPFPVEGQGDPELRSIVVRRAPGEPAQVIFEDSVVRGAYGVLSPARAFRLITGW